MCCLVSMFLLLGTRMGGIFWWLASPVLWQAAFSSRLGPLLGLAFLPWTTLMYVLVFTEGVTGSEWLWMALAVMLDLASYLGSAYGSGNRAIEMKSYWNPY